MLSVVKPATKRRAERHYVYWICETCVNLFSLRQFRSRTQPTLRSLSHRTEAGL